jgi:hypothetical protein
MPLPNRTMSAMTALPAADDRLLMSTYPLVPASK